MTVWRWLCLFCCILACGCGTTRNTSLDHRLLPFKTPTLDLTQYRSVQTREGQDGDLALAVAISGGGHRAANFAMGALLGLESFEVDGKTHNLLREVDYLSTVSGGGFTAGIYVSTLHDHLRKGRPRNDYSLTQTLQAHDKRLLVNLERDYQMTILEAMVHFRCATTHRDGGDLTERKYDRYLLGYKYRKPHRSLTLGDVFKPANSTDPVELPYWVMNATVYENGARFPFTPNILSRYHVAGYTHQMRKKDLKGDPYTMPLAVGVKASASFPVAFPASTFACKAPQDQLNPYLHLLDGGLTDNTGVATAFDLLRQDKARRKLLLIVDAHRGSSQPLSRWEVSPQGTEAAYRIMKMCLDTQHSHQQQEIDRQVKLASADGGAKIEVVFLTFEQLKPALTSQIKDLRAAVSRLKKEQREATVRRFQREIDAALQREGKALTTAEKTYALYLDARAVATSLNITRGEQRLLLRAGRKVVDKNRERIQAAIIGKPVK